MGTVFNGLLSKRVLASVLAWIVFGISLGNPSPASSATQAEYVLLIVLEGVGAQAVHSGFMPVLHRLGTEGAVTWAAKSVSPPLTVPSMASLLTGISVDKHRIDEEWETYDFSRSFLRAPTLFDYMDLAGGLDTAVFFMDERFYQLARPEIYVDAQMCGRARPDCKPSALVVYIRDYLEKVISEGGHGFHLFTVPSLLLAHLPAASHAGTKRGWGSTAYQEVLRAVDTAIGEIIHIYREFKVLDQTMVIVTGLNSGTYAQPQGNGVPGTPQDAQGRVLWLAWGANVQPRHQIKHGVSIMDTGATVMEALGLETHTEWESHALREIFQTVPKRRTTGNE